MSHRVVLTPEARADVLEAATWYRERSPAAVDAFLLAIRASLTRLADEATAHPVLDSGTGVRRALLKRFPHRVLYLIDGDRVVVFAVMHRARHDPAWRQCL